MSSSFQPSATLRHARPTKTSQVASAASSLSPGVEGLPSLGRWYAREYGIGPRPHVRFLTRNTPPEHRHASVRFRTPGGGNATVADLNFGGGGGSSGGGGSLAVAAGPRVSLYGGADRAGAGTSDLARALRAGSAAQRRRDADFDDEGSVDLFGGASRRAPAGKVAGEEERLDDVGPDRNISTGGLIAHCASHRGDGRLVAVGTEGGGVRICDANSRATLRTFQSAARQGGGGDRKAIRAVSWLRDGKRVVAGGDDGVVRVWDVGGGTRDGGIGGGGAHVTLRGHGDRVTSVEIISYRRDDRPGARQKSKRGGKKRQHDDPSTNRSSEDPFLSPWGQLAVSGSYDHTIRVWDVDAPSGEDRCVSFMKHGDPVQALLILPPVKGIGKASGRPLLVSAGGTTLKVWNPFNGSCLGTFPTKHAKTITSMCLLDIQPDGIEDGESDRAKRHIVTGGLDGLIRIHSVSREDIASKSLPFLHGMQTGEPVSALAASSDASRLAVGTTTGIVTVYRRRRSPAALAASRARAEAEEGREPRRGTHSHFQRGAHEKSHDPDDYLLQHQKRQRLAEYDQLLRKFRYGDALDAVLAKRQPQAVVAVIEELGKRRGLTIALSNRDEETLDAILSFTIRFIDNPQYTPHLIGVAHILCDIYGSLRGQSAVVDELFARLREKVAGECTVQRMLLRLLGQIDFVMATAETMSAEEQQR